MSSPIAHEYESQHPLSTNRGGRASAWFLANARAVGIAGAAIVLAAVGAVAWRASERAKGARAEQALYQAAATFGSGDPRQSEQALRGVATRYAGTSGGTQAQLLLAQSLYEQGRYQDGINVLGRGKAPDELADAVRLLTAAGYEGLNRGADAARIYESVAGRADLGARRQNELRAAAARAYQLAGDRGAALRLWQQIVAAGAGPLAEEARVRIGELQAATRAS